MYKSYNSDQNQNRCEKQSSTEGPVATEQQLWTEGATHCPDFKTFFIHFAKREKLNWKDQETETGKFSKGH